MGHSISKYLEEDADFRQRAIDEAFKKNPNIKTFDELIEAFKEGYDTPTGRRILNKWNDDESKILWESDEVQRRVKENRGVDESEDIVSEEEDFEVVRARPKGQSADPRDIQIVKVERKVQVKPYVKNGRQIKGYKASRQKWGNAEKKFLEVRRAKGYSTRDIVKEYNEVFSEKQRTESSIKTRLYRS